MSCPGFGIQVPDVQTIDFVSMLPLCVELEKPFLPSRMQIQELLLVRTTVKENQDQTCDQSDAKKGERNSACARKNDNWPPQKQSVSQYNNS